MPSFANIIKGNEEAIVAYLFQNKNATTDEEDAAPKKPARPAGGKAAPKKKKAEE